MVCGEEVGYGPKRSAKGTEDEWCWPWRDGKHLFSKIINGFPFPYPLNGNNQLGGF